MNWRFVVILFATLLMGIVRVFIVDAGSPWSQLTPVGAMALFGGAMFSSRTKSLAFPLLTLFISDLVLNFTVFADYRKDIMYEGFQWVYLAFVLMVLISRFLQPGKGLLRFLRANLAVVFIHWIVTDLGVWMGSSLYPQTAMGFISCLVAAIPFELPFLVSSLLYSSLFFGAIWVSQRSFPVLRATA